VNKNDLVYTHKTSLVDILRCLPFEVETFDGRKLVVAPDNVQSPAYAKCVAGEGMPIYEGLEASLNGGGKSRGNLYIKFDVEFPKQLSKAQKDKISALCS
jgi:DnaJ family protein B protein 13